MLRCATRIDDLPTLIRDFATLTFAAGRQRVQFSASALDCLLRYSWPGNVRELGISSSGFRFSVRPPGHRCGPAPAVTGRATGRRARKPIRCRQCCLRLQMRTSRRLHAGAPVPK